MTSQCLRLFAPFHCIDYGASHTTIGCMLLWCPIHHTIEIYLALLLWCPAHQVHQTLTLVFQTPYLTMHCVWGPVHHTSPGIVYGVSYTIPHQALYMVSRAPYLTRHCVWCPIHHTSPGIDFGVLCTIPHQAWCLVSCTS